MRYLLDTSALITRPAPERFAPDAEFLICTISIAELNAGLHTARNPIELSTRVSRLQWISDNFVPIPFTVSDAQKYGLLTALTIAVGRNPRPRQMDLLIASVAATRGLPLVTHNAKDFIGLADAVEVIDLNQAEG
jgi:predicted nucleic acid-binding protein